MYRQILNQLKGRQMKKLILLISLLLLSWSSFSQKDTKKDSIVPLKVPIAKLVIKDLIEGDGNKLVITDLNKLLDLNKEKLKVKDSVITTLGTKIFNLETIIVTKDEQFKLQQELSQKLQKELKSQKRKTFFYKVGAGVGTVATILLLVQK
jgi:hypothetical protein